MFCIKIIRNTVTFNLGTARGDISKNKWLPFDMVVAVIIWKNEAESNVDCFGILGSLHKFPGEETGKIQRIKEISFISFPFPSNSSFPSILSPGISHLDSAPPGHVFDLSLSLSLSLLTQKCAEVLGTWTPTHSISALFPLFS